MKVFFTLLLLASATALARADGYGCNGGNGRAECGVSFDPNNPYRPSGQCSNSCSGGSCGCPASNCMKLVSACLVDSNTVSYQISFDTCKGGNKGDSAIDWVAFQATNAAENSFTIHVSAFKIAAASPPHLLKYQALGAWLRALVALQLLLLATFMLAL